MGIASRAIKSLRNRRSAAAHRARGVLHRLDLGPALEGAHGLSCGSNVRLDVYGRLTLGRGVRLMDGSYLCVGPGATLTLGDGVFVGRYSVVVAAGSITIGSHTLIAEHVSIRDSDHSLNRDHRRHDISTVEPVVLGDDVWIAAGARVLRGTRLGDGVVVGANAVVRGDVAAGLVVAGIPARVVKEAIDSSRRGNAS